MLTTSSPKHVMTHALHAVRLLLFSALSLHLSASCATGSPAIEGDTDFIPKVALLVLTGSPSLDNEALWAAWLQQAGALRLKAAPPRAAVAAEAGEVDLLGLISRGGAQGLFPPLQPSPAQEAAEEAAVQQALQSLPRSHRSAGQSPSCTHPLRHGAWRRYFSLYVNYAYAIAPHSILCGSVIDGSVLTDGAYAQDELAQAAVALVAAALNHPLNLRFVLVSETSIPLWPPEMVWAELLWESQSRMHCFGQRDLTALSSDANMWSNLMTTPYVQRKHWRKTGEWFMINRKVAALVAADRHVREVFRRHCRTTPDWIARANRTTAMAAVAAARAAVYGDNSTHRVCVSDEHYVPTLLAAYGLADQVDCTAGVHHVLWEPKAWHPRTYGAADMTPSLVHHLRWGMKHAAAMVAVEAAALRSLSHVFEASEVSGGLVNAVSHEADALTELGAHGSNHIAAGAEPTSRGVSGHRTETASGHHRQQYSSSSSSALDTVVLGTQSLSRIDEWTKRSLLGAWLEDELGFHPVGTFSSLLARKFPRWAANATFDWALSCHGLGINRHCG